ncbi:hypothetical protein H6F67_01025 [Microcoleus sp. FACHB-1515]|uniref:hypothetical protein n=1 Tax=Cyanophyceae TaxID=3028117 RepID=UPI001683ADE2|nr:hypothetical protein [Microcoleus sp. FACHB-1515]MBD2088454.1 hypothetical protein [Microcoleus sp. FACHB-1515]
MNLCFLHPIPARRFWKPRRPNQPMQDKRIRSSDRIQAIRKLEHLYFLERRGLL